MAAAGFCRVRSCRFKFSHVTRGHACGTCGALGHGQTECGRRSKTEALEALYSNDEMPPDMRCKVRFCTSSRLHATSGHVCPDCGSRKECSCNEPAPKRCPMCNVVSGMQWSLPLFTGEPCVACCDDSRLYAFLGCGHVCLCETCAIALR